MKRHNLTESRTGNNDLPLVQITGGDAPMVFVEYKNPTGTRMKFHREWIYYSQPELSLQSIAEALDTLATEMDMSADLRVKLQMCMGEAYGRLIARMRAEWPEGTEGTKRPRH